MKFIVNRFFKAIGFEVVVLALLLIWFILSVSPLPFIQYSDGYFLWMPRLSYVAKEILSGRIPFWNEYQFCGTALLSDGNTNIYNPAMILYLFMKPEWGYTFTTLFLFVILLAGTWLYFKEKNFSKEAAMVGTIGYVYGGQVIFWSLYHGMNIVLSLFPLLLFFLRRYEKTGKVGWKVFAFISAFFIFCGGFIQFSIIAALSIIIEGIERFSFKDFTRVLKTRLPVISFAFISSLFSIIPTIETAIFSHRELVPYFNGLFPEVINLLSMAFWGTSLDRHSYPNYFYFLGIVLISLAISTVRREHKNVFSQPFFVYSFIFPSIIVLIYSKVLPVNFQFGIESDIWRGMFVFNLSLSLLAATAVEIFMRRLENSSKKSFPPMELLFAGFISVCFGIYNFSPALNIYCIFDIIIIICLGILMILGFTFPIVFKEKRPKLKVIFSVWFITLMAVNVFYVCNNDYLSVDTFKKVKVLNPWELKKLPVEALANKEGRFIQLGLDDYFLEDWGIYNKIRSLGGYGSFFPNSIFSRMKKDGILPSGFHAITHFKNNNVLDPDIMARYGVLYLIKLKDYGFDPLGLGWQFVMNNQDRVVYKNPKYVGRAYVVDRQGRIIKGASIVKNTNSYVKISLNANEGEILILADSWFPGWVCYDNSRKVVGFDAGGFRGYTIKTGGYHEVEWIYRPKIFIVSVVISCIGIVIFLFMIYREKYFLWYSKDTSLF